MDATYDRIGVNYAELRRPDPRIAAAIDAALGNARTIVNIGAGAGSYEPSGRLVTAVEPSIEMIRQRPADAAPAVRAFAEELPFDDDSFDVAMAVLTVHHWRDKAAGLREMRRVARDRVVLLTFDPAHRPWLTDYLPELIALDEAQMPAMSGYAGWLGPVEVRPVPIPHDCSDGFLYAYWRRPHAYLDPRIRTGSSSFWAMEDAEAGLARLADDLETGDWARRYGDLLGRDAYDAGYRLIIASELSR